MTGTMRRSMFVAVIGAVAASATVALADTRLQGAGATFPAPLYQRMVAEYEKLHPDIQIDYQSIGSGGGIKAITEQTVGFCGSDAPMSTKEMDKAGGTSNLVEIPSCAGGVVPSYNLAGLSKSLNFTGELLAEIYMGKVTKWNDPAIAKVNPGVKLPESGHHARLAHRRLGHHVHLDQLPRDPERGVQQHDRHRASRSSGPRARAARGTRASRRSSSRPRAPSATSSRATRTTTTSPTARCRTRTGSS